MENIQLKREASNNFQHASKYNAYLLSLFVEEKIIAVENTQEYVLLIKSILNFRIDKSLIRETDMETERAIKERYHFMVFWCKLIADKPNLSYSQKNRLFNAVMDKKYNKNNSRKFHSFISAISERMNMDYIFRYSLAELEFVFKIYELNQAIFEYPILKTNINRTDNILECFFKDYIISGLFLENFFSLNQTEEEWFLHLIKGEGMHTAKNLPLPLTKKAAHIFRGFSRYIGTNNGNIEGRYGLSIEKGFIHASFLSLGVSEEFSYAAIRRIFNTNESGFWVTTLSNFYKKGLFSEDLPLVIDYINDQTLNLNRMVNWKRKTLDNLIDEAVEWHSGTLNEYQLLQAVNVVFEKSSISNYSIEIPGINKDNQIYSIKQLSSSNELYAEGQLLSHCVYSYRNFCASNSCQIFSMSITDQANKSKPLLTIEVRETGIYQVRGEYNRDPHDNELEIIKMWAKKEGLLIAS
jgi:hypothetical protein